MTGLAGVAGIENGTSQDEMPLFLDATEQPCDVVRCLMPAAWALTMHERSRFGTERRLLTGHYCAEHAGLNVRCWAAPGRRITLDAVGRDPR